MSNIVDNKDIKELPPGKELPPLNPKTSSPIGSPSTTLPSELTPGEKLHVEFSKNPLVWGMTYLPEHFRKDSPPFHLKIINEALSHRFFACASPRESAKSTIVNFLLNIHDIVFKRARFIVLLQSTEEKSQATLAGIKYEVKNNPKFKQYGIKLEKDTKDYSMFVHPDGFFTHFMCFGREQMEHIRGIKIGPYRPDRINIDDLEGDKSVKNPVLRQEMKESFDQIIIPAGQKGECWYRVIGTIFHDDSLMAKLVSPREYTKWRKLLFRALNKENTPDEFSLWEEQWDLAWLHEKRATEPDVFAMEYQNDPVSGLLTKFHKDNWRYWYIEDNQAVLMDEANHVTARYELSSCKAAISCDLAIEEKRTSDDTVIMPGFLTPNSELLIDNYICEKGMEPSEFEEYIFAMEQKYRNITKKPVPIGFEKGKLEKFMKKWLQRSQRERNHFLLYKDLVWGADKIERIVTRLQPRYKQHMIFHRNGMGKLEHQLLRVPSGSHDDCADAAQGLVQLLQYAPTSKSPNDDKEKDNKFNQVRKWSIDHRKGNNRPFVFGNKRLNDIIPSVISPIN